MEITTEKTQTRTTIKGEHSQLAQLLHAYGVFQRPL